MTEPARQFTCEDVFRRLDEFIDRELSDLDMRLVEKHLQACAQCASEHRFEQRVLDDIRGKLGRIKAPDDLIGRVRKAIGSMERGNREGPRGV
jgi:anti-sigma factor (TIGR02949 family)